MWLLIRPISSLHSIFSSILYLRDKGDSRYNFTCDNIDRKVPLAEHMTAVFYSRELSLETVSVLCVCVCVFCSSRRSGVWPSVMQRSSGRVSGPAWSCHQQMVLRKKLVQRTALPTAPPKPMAWHRSLLQMNPGTQHFSRLSHLISLLLWNLSHAGWIVCFADIGPKCLKN